MVVTESPSRCLAGHPSARTIPADGQTFTDLGPMLHRRFAKTSRVVKVVLARSARTGYKVGLIAVDVSPLDFTFRCQRSRVKGTRGGTCSSVRNLAGIGPHVGGGSGAVGDISDSLTPGLPPDSRLSRPTTSANGHSNPGGATKTEKAVVIK